ncbi:MAG TPA: cysteine desulfurase family protein [Geobacteraceae bacterium]
MVERIYFDNSATTPLDPRVREAMAPYLDGVYGNPSSLHAFGLAARQAVNRAREEVAALLGAAADEIVFAASGTEAANLAIIGAVEALGVAGSHVITSAVEHPAVLMACRYLEERGAQVTRLPVDGDGLVAPTSLSAALRPNTRLVSVMAANNVVGTLQPIAELARLARERSILFHTDAVQAAGKIPLDVGTLPVDLLSLAPHKFNGPKGVGALYRHRGVALKPIVHGGGQEQGLRSATENVAGIVGLGAAACIARQEMAAEAARLVQLRERIVTTLERTVPAAYLIGHRHRRLPGHLCLGIADQEGDAMGLLLALDEAGVAVSTGSACSAGHRSEPSYILTAMGYDPIRARGSLRITLGRFTTDAEVERFLAIFPDIAGGLRRLNTRSSL